MGSDLKCPVRVFLHVEMDMAVRVNTPKYVHNIPAPKNFHVDFERGAVNAVSAVYLAR